MENFAWVTGLFASLAGCMIFLNVVQAVKDKEIKGVSPITLWFFTIQCIWFFIYFYCTNDPTVAYGYIIPGIANIAYVGAYYKYKGKQ